MKTSELTGAPLDWAVAQCEGLIRDPHGGWVRPATEGLSSWRYGLWTPSNNWAQGGAIIERECISVVKEGDAPWAAWSRAPFRDEAEAFGYGNTPLEAAMRCYIASKLGDEVQIPEELK